MTHLDRDPLIPPHQADSPHIHNDLNAAATRYRQSTSQRHLLSSKNRFCRTRHSLPYDKTMTHSFGTFHAATIMSDHDNTHLREKRLSAYSANID